MLLPSSGRGKHSRRLRSGRSEPLACAAFAIFCYQTLRISKHRLFAKKYFESASGTCHRRSQEIARITVEVPTKKTGSQALVRFDCIHPVLAVCLHVPHLFQCEAHPDQENKFKTLHEVADLYVCPWFILIESTHTCSLQTIDCGANSECKSLCGGVAGVCLPWP